jgi:DNA polymerase-3 subunit epsilon
MIKYNKILIVDIETTGTSFDTDYIVEIGIALLNLKIVNHKNINLLYYNSWPFKNTSIKFIDVISSKDISYYKNKLQKLFNTYFATAYNKQFDFTFLERNGINIPNQLPCPMIVATDILKIENYFGYKWPKVEEAWKYFFPNKLYTEIHRGYDDAKHEAMIIFKMYTNGLYLINNKVDK